MLRFDFLAARTPAHVGGGGVEFFLHPKRPRADVGALSKSITPCRSILLHQCLGRRRNRSERETREEVFYHPSPPLFDFPVSECVSVSDLRRPIASSSPDITVLQVLRPVGLVPRCHQAPPGRRVRLEGEGPQQRTDRGFHLQLHPGEPDTQKRPFHQRSVGEVHLKSQH